MDSTTHYYTLENKPGSHLILASIGRLTTLTLATARNWDDAALIVKALNAYQSNTEGAR